MVTVAVAVLAIAVGCGGAHVDPAATPNTKPRPAVTKLRPTVLAQIPHDPATFTEGLEIDGPNLYESTGKAGQSELRELDPATGAVRRAVPLPHGYFGEGITVVGDRIWQLTFHNGVAIEWDKATLTPVREVKLSGEGWGLCWDGTRLVRSDGTNRLHFHKATDFTEIGSVPVTTPEGKPIKGLNELACVNGQVWANVFPTDLIARIDPGSGLVTAGVDAHGLLAGPRAKNAVLNGIANIDGETFLLTGKYWPSIFRVRFDPVP